MTIAEWLQTNDQMCIDIVKRKYLLDEDIKQSELLELIKKLNEDNTVNGILSEEEYANEKKRILSEL